MTIRTLMAATALACVAAAPAAAADPIDDARVAPGARGSSPWQTEDYKPKPGNWRPYVLAPSDRSLAPASVMAANPRQGAIEGDPSAALRADGRSVQLRSTGGRAGSPLLTLDFGQEIAGKVRVKVSGTSDPRPKLHACFSESRRYMALGSRNEGQAAFAPGCDTANINVGLPGVPYTYDADSHELTVPAQLPGVAADTQRRGGFRYLTLFLDGPGTVDVDAVSTDFTAVPAQADPAEYEGWFLSSDDALNRIWYAGAYTVQINTDTADAAKSWPYKNGEADHIDTPLPGVMPGKQVIYDGGKRDRIVWQGDLAVQDPVTFLSTNDRAAVDTSLDSLAAQQEPDGYVPAASLVGPHNFGEKRTYGEYVTWFISNMADHHRYTGDVDYVKRWWPALQRATAYLEGVRGKDPRGLIAFSVDGACGHYGYRDCGHETYINALYKRNLDQMADLALAVGASGAAYKARSAVVAKAIQDELWDETAGAFRLSRELPAVHPQDANATAILAGVASDAQGRRALDFLRRATWARFGSLTVSLAEPNGSLPAFYAPLPSGFEADARLAGTRDDRGLETENGLDLIRRFWGHQLAQDPQSTFIEHLQPDGTTNIGAFSSLAHGWASAPTTLLSTRVLGVDATGPGFSRFDVAPHPGDVRWAQGAIPTPHGPIRASWTSRGDDGLSLDLANPSGTTGRASLPTAGRKVRVRVDGKTVWDGDRALREGVTEKDGRILVDGLAAGRHDVRVTALSEAAPTELRLSLTPPRTSAVADDIVALRASLSGVSRHRLRGTLSAEAPEGWTISPATRTFDESSGGRPASTTVRLFAVVPDDVQSGTYPIRVTAKAQDGTTATDVAQIVISSDRTVFDFEQDTQGWVAGAAVASVAKVSRFANGPGKPLQGTGALEATAEGVPGSTLKSVRVDLAKPLDLTAATSLRTGVNLYGGAPGAQGYEAVLTARSGDDVRTVTAPVTPDSWNSVALDLTNWPGRSRITAVEVGMRATGTDQSWQPRFQIDDVGVTE